MEKENYDVLLTGDIEFYDEPQLVADVTADTGTVDVYKAGHHAISTSNAAETLEAFNPQAITITHSGDENKYKEADRMSEYAPVYFSDVTTVIDLTDTSNGIEIIREGEVVQTIVNDFDEGTRLDK